MKIDSKKEEYLYAIMNLLNAEEHFIELLETQENKEFILQRLKKTKELRIEVLDSLFNTEELKNILYVYWCPLKHLLLAKYHIMEIINKNDYNLELDHINKEIKEEINLLIEKIFEEKKTGFFEKLKPCKRCFEDLNKIFNKNKKNIKQHLSSDGN